MEDENKASPQGQIDEQSPNQNAHSADRSVRTKVPEVEVRLYRRGKGLIDVFQSKLGGWDQNQLEVRDICDRYGFKSLYAFNTETGRGVPIRFNSKNGRSFLPYKDGSVIYVEGEPKDSAIKPTTRIVLGILVITFLIALVVKEKPFWFQKIQSLSGSFPPWILACMVVVFTRMRKRTKQFLQKHGW